MPSSLYTCSWCRNVFEIEWHQSAYLDNKRVIVCGTGMNMVYRGDFNREYAVCPACGKVEDPLSVEIRDQDEEALDGLEWPKFGLNDRNLDGDA